MNARGYIRIVRPLRTLVFAAIQGVTAWALIALALRFRADEARRLFFSILAPLIVGKTLLRPLEDLMHREGCALLPGAHRAFAKYHAVAFVIAAIALIAAGWHWNSGYPLPILATMVVSMLAVPLLIDRDDRAGRAVGRVWRSGMAAVTGVLAVGCLKLTEPSRSLFAWFIFGASLVVARWGFRYYFDLRRVRAKGTLPYLNLQSVFLAASGVERTDHRSLPRKKGAGLGLDWRAGRTGGSAWWWIRVLVHVRFGRFKGLARQLVKIGVLQVPALLLVITMNVLQGHRGWGAAIADLLKPGNTEGLFNVSTPTGDTLRMMMMITCVVPAQFQATALRISLPISRIRQAHYGWLFSVTLSVAFVLAQIGGMAIALMLLAAVVEHTLRLPLAVLLVGVLVEVAVMIPLLLGAMEVTRTFATKLGWSVPRAERLAGLVASMILAGLVPLPLPSLNRVLGGPGVITVLLIVAVIASFVYRAVLQENFLGEDLAAVDVGPRGV